MKIGIGISCKDIKQYKDDFEVINIENPLYPNYLSGFLHKDIKMIKQQSVGNKIIVDGVYIDINPATPEKEIQKVVYKKVKRSIEYALSINAGEIIFLSTYIPQIGLESYIKSHIESSIKFWENVCKKYSDIQISLGNIFEYTPEVLLEIWKGVNCRNFMLAFDIGHALAYGKIKITEWAKEIEGKYTTAYLHSNDAECDMHLDFDRAELLKQLTLKELKCILSEKTVILKPFDRGRAKELQKKILSGTA